MRPETAIGLLVSGVRNMGRKEAIRSAYRLTGGNNFYDGMIHLLHPERKSGVPFGMGYE